MNIQSSNLLAGTNKAIQVANTCFIAKEGPNMISKMGIGDLNIKYDSVFTTRQTIKASGKDTPIMYGFLGTDITFLLIKPIYAYTNPQAGCSGSTSNYLEYYFEDEPLIRRTLTDILVLSGDADHRIPQVYLYNPTKNIVTVDIMAANLDENTITTSLVPTYSELKGLSFSSIQTDQLYGLYAGPCTGSTQFEIKDINGNTQMVIPYNRIDIININNEVLTVSTRSDDPVKLYFLSNFNAQQALSRMNWVMEQSLTRYATSTYPGLDTTAPVITFNPNNYIMNYVNGVVTPAAIRFKYITNVIDYDNNNILRDGTINTADVNLLILNNNTGEQVSAVTYDGRYSVTFTAKDLAGNSTSSTKPLIVDGTPPTIFYTSASTANQIDIFGTPTPGTIFKNDLNVYYIDYVWDDVDGQIPNSAVTISINSGNTAYTAITNIGYYDINFSVFDAALNERTGYTLLHVTESSIPQFIYNNVFSGSAFTMSISANTSSTTGITQQDIRTFALSSVIDAYDGVISLSNVVVSGSILPTPIDSPTEFEITFNVSDISGNEKTETKWLIVTV